MNKVYLDQISYNTSEKEKQLIEQLLADPEVKQLLEQQEASEQAVINNPWIFQEWLQSQAEQVDVKGNVRPQNADESYYKALEIEDDQPYWVIKRTSRQKIEDAKLAHKANYLYSDLPDEAYSIDIDRIDLAKESSKYQVLVRNIRDWIKTVDNGQADKGLYIHGSFGVGKTYLAICITNYLAKAGHKVGFVHWPSFLNEAKNSFGSDSDFLDSSLRKLRKAEVIVIDDIATYASTKHSVPIRYLISA